MTMADEKLSYYHSVSRKPPAPRNPCTINYHDGLDPLKVG
ncbi:MAG: hypothetical protein ACI8QD_002609 [Cyclobacteriaceae bacterium]